MKRRSFTTLLGAAIVPSHVARAQGQNGVALVIGNSKYKWDAQLPNVKRDVPDIARRFEQFGLKTELLQDVGHDAMRQAIDRFLAASRGAKLAAFYFAGHGAQWEKTSYMVPADADLSSPNAVKTFPSVSSIRQGTGEAAHRLLIFDSCRNNPADDWRQQWALDQSVVYAGTSHEPNTVMLYSTAPGHAALDGPAGQNSPFASALLRQLANPSVDLKALPGKLRRDLLIATEGRQVVWDLNSYPESFPLNGPAGAAPAAGGGSGADAARIVELPNVYAFARQIGLVMPLGIVAFRPRSGANADKVGSYRMNFPNNIFSLIAVMSVEDPNAVEMVMASNGGSLQQLAHWKLVRGKISGDTLEFTSGSAGGHHEYKWKDVNSGSGFWRNLNPTGKDSGAIVRASFTRLD